ncbi:PEP/pyruvate-binding domain-containing protein [Patulibacter brassicae]|uniref:PEP/pyruvate-binding domain-containing protein n=1 Tax=Patulibacter brassicae TaxID=1705717 RepID=A0ABU4VLP9_9ACTN|nr:PEP/pyruvate-binding domain-containing protein [Patulibacter brassicae]MDX8152752.1 PEP/pyruvate-binding domain-containing protein [Patulibacter brassicae]
MTAEPPIVDTTEARPTVWFADPQATDHDVVGGKGANLGRLVQAGFPVPEGFVVSTRAYDAHVDALRDGVRELLDGLPAGDLAALEDAAATIRERIEQAAIPDAVSMPVRAAYAELGSGFVAVRSSGTAEDLEGAAFAGQHDTYLDVRGENELLDAVRGAWASLYTARAIDYRRQRGIDPLPSIAVVVQRMVASEVAGVLFTADPVRRRTDRLLVNASWGLGEAVVSGITTPDQLVVEHGSWRVLDRVIGGKEVEVVRDPETGRGTIERDVEPERRARPALDDERAAELARLGARVAEHYGSPQDVEWALADGTLVLLQARPVTGVDFSLPPEPDGPDLDASPVHLPGSRVRWTTANVDEAFPGIVTPLTWSVYDPATEATMRDCWTDFGVLRERERGVPADVDLRFITVAHGRAIANVDVMCQLAGRLPGSSAAQMEEQLFGSVPEENTEPPFLERIRRWPIVAVRMPLTVRRRMREQEQVAADVFAWWGRVAFGVAHATLADAVDLLAEARRRYAEVTRSHMVLSIMAQGLLAKVESLAQDAGLPGLERELVRSDHGTAEFDLVRDLQRLARDEIDVPAFQRAHGYHGPREGLVESVSWREDPSLVRELAAAYRRRPEAEDVERIAARGREARADAMARLREAVGPARWPLVRAIVRFSGHAPMWRERGRAAMLQTVDAARAASRAVGRHLHDEGVLQDPRDVQFLTIEELEALDRDAIPALVAQRRVDHAAFEAAELPHVWHGVPEPVAASADPGDGSTRRLTGLGVSSGVAEGTVRVITDLAGADIPEGTILVCHATDPSWASLFPLASAVVTNVGSALSHAAIVCRELGLPCVSNTRTGTRDLRDGMRVRVDGAAGVVEVLDA